MTGDYFFYTKQLTVGYNGKPLIKEIEIQLQQGQILTLIGPNGSGKSTILKSLTKHLAAVYGTVYIDNRSIADMSNKDMSRKVAVVLTDKPHTQLMTCEDVVATGRYPYTGSLGILSENDKHQVRSAMKLVNAWDMRDQNFSEISDGQRQRIMLARAICQQPQIIVLDEPTSFLDVRYGLELLSILRMMAKEKKITVITSLHELDMAQKISDLVMCVKGEYITKFGTPQDIFRKEFISELYDLKNGSYNPLFGSFEMGRPTGEAKIFVIAGGGTGIPQYRLMQKKQIPFATGILHENDIDYQVACDLAVEVFSVPGFQRIDDDTYRNVINRLSSCNTIINCLESYGEMNDKNRELLEHALKLGITILKSAEEIEVQS